MVVLAACVLTKSGKTLLSRQFVELARVRIEGLLSAFPKLLDPTSQHTFIETANVRYLYQPIEDLYVVVITTKASNILEDLDTLHLFAKIIPDTCDAATEEQVCQKAFELIFAFDEVVALGYKEKVTLAQIRTFIEMDSHEERIHDLVEKNKMKDVRDTVKRKQKEMKRPGARPGYGSGSSNNSSKASSGRPAPHSSAAASEDPYLVPKQEGAAKKAAEQRRRGTSGMKLGGKAGGKKDTFLEHLMDEGDMGEEEYAAALAPSNPGASTGADAAAVLPQVKHEDVHVDIEEKVTAVLSNDGGLQQLDVTGELRLSVRDAAMAKVTINTTHSDAKMQFKTHPNVNKAVFLKDGVIQTKNPDRGFPVGAALGVVKWRLSTTDDDLLPLSVSCWPSPGTSETIVNCEYELLDTTQELRSVVIRVPLPGGSMPVVGDVDGTHAFDHKAERLLWQLDLIDVDNASGTLEFTLPFVVDGGALFPIDVSFASEKTFSTIVIDSMQVDGQDVVYSQQRSLAVERFTVEQ